MPSDYVTRIVDRELDDLLAGLPAISLEGPRGVGKTSTALQRAATTHRLDDPDQFAVIEARRRRLVEGTPPILIDEWQLLPESWDFVRRAVDEDDTPGRFLLTGSAKPTQSPTHSGAGRIVTVRMRPLSLAERLADEPTVSLGALLSGTKPDLGGDTNITVDDYTAEIVRSDFADLDHRIRDAGALRRWLTAYAAATSTAATFETVRDAASAGEAHKPARSTTQPYRATLEQLWLIEEVPAWRPTRNRLRRLAAAPVHQLADPALAARLLGCDETALLAGSSPGPSVPRDGPLLGALFQSLVTLSVRTYAQQNQARVHHLRTQGGEHEIDLIIERGDGRVLALEVKLASTVNDRDLRHLRWLANSIGPELLDAAVITTGPHAYRRRDGIGVIPAALLTI